MFLFLFGQKGETNSGIEMTVFSVVSEKNKAMR